MLSQAQIDANRRNAQMSTGPTSEEGKGRARMNALRNGLTAQVAIMPEEDRAAYDNFCSEIIESLNPETPIERQLAHAIADSYFRLNRASGLETNMFVLGHFEAIGEFDAGHPEIHTALTHARVFRDQTKQFELLTLYEQRIHRNLEKITKRLAELQSQRRAGREKAAEETHYSERYATVNR